MVPGGQLATDTRNARLGSTIGFCKEKGCCCCAVGMCENSRQRVIHISSAVAVIFLSLQVACAVVGG